MTKLGTCHPQVSITHGELAADVDEEIAPLVLGLWRLGLQTMQSCQRHVEAGKVWIMFATAAYAEVFLDCVLADADEDEQSWARAESWYFGMFYPDARPLPKELEEPLHPAGWEFYVSATDASLANGRDLPDFRIEIAVLFPCADLKRVTEAVLNTAEAVENEA